MESEKREQPEWVQKIIFELNKKKESSEEDSCMDIQYAEDNADI